jgi:hypothetical protein
LVGGTVSKGEKSTSRKRRVLSEKKRTDELAEGAEVLDGLVGVSVHLVLVGTGRDVLDRVERGSVGLLGVVVEVLDELVVVLLGNDLPQDADDVWKEEAET